MVVTRSNREDDSRYSTNSKKVLQEKAYIIERFNQHVKGKKYICDNNKHCGKEGHWLEVQMGISPNSKNEPDNCGWEQKKSSKKISFGDWSASWYLFSKNNRSDIKMSRSEFIKTFGSPNAEKNNRYSWSGRVFPTYGLDYNYAGQRIRFLESDDLVIEYSYKNDTREDKEQYNKKLHTTEPLIIAMWDKKKIENHVIKKFGVMGFYICEKNKNNIYDKISFGNTISFEFFKECIIDKRIYIDSGMYDGNARNYSQFRSNACLWKSLITEVF